MTKFSSGQLDSPLQIYLRLLAYSRRYWPVTAIAIVAMMLGALTDTGLAWMMKPLLDGSFVQRDTRLIKIMPLIVLGLFLLRGVASFVSDYGLGYVGRQLIKRLRSELFNHLLRLPAGYYDRTSSGQLLTRVTFSIEQLAASGSQVILVLVRDTFKIISLLGLMFYINAMLATFALSIGPVIAILVRQISQRFRKMSARIQTSVGDVTHITEEVIQGQRVVKVFNAQEYESQQFNKANERNRRLNMRRVTAQAANNPTVQLIAALPVAGIVYVATSDAVGGAMSPGDFAAFLGAMIGLFTPLRALTSLNTTIQSGIAAAAMIFEVLDVAPEKDNGSQRLGRARGEVEYSHVTFAYDPQKGAVLHDINLHLHAGETVALVGRSGSGKSTLANLLPRFYDVQEGRILIDGIDITEIKLADLREQISLVSQEITLFNDTVAANIAYGALGKATQAQIIEAAKAAYAWDFIRALPDGLATQVGQRGIMLSGGQRQRIAIARALLKDAPILILDEATSALDTESERHIQIALERLMAQRTTLVIAHRLSTIENADRIVVMHNGHIVEQGRHQELLAQNGRYADLYRMQFRDDVVTPIIPKAR
jgi:subfamily B ATP-binding cassette protein MsbA